MIYGIGVDIVHVVRIETALRRWGTRFTERIFTDRERKYCSAQKAGYISYACRFAAKEAFSKALGTGIGGEIGWKDVWIENKENGRPELCVSDRAASLLHALGITRRHVSLAHEREYAVAYILLES